MLETETYLCTECEAEFAVIVYNWPPHHPDIWAEYMQTGPKACPICDTAGAQLSQLNTRGINAPGAKTT